MKQFIIVDKLDGWSWVSETIEEAMIGMGYSEEDGSWDEIKEQVKDMYEVIEVVGEVKYLVD
jgi:hypothetical protein